MLEGDGLIGQFIKAMKIVLSCNDAEALKKAIIKAAEDDTLKTWETRSTKSEGKVLTHSTSTRQWEDEVLIVLVPLQNDRPFSPDTLEARVSWWEKKPEPPHDVKAYITGRFTEVLLAHFSKKFTDFRIEK